MKMLSFPKVRGIVIQSILICKGDEGFHHLLQFLYTGHQLMWFTCLGQSSFLGPKLQCLCICQSLSWLFQPDILTHKMSSTLGEEGIPINALGVRWQGVIVCPFPPAIYFRELKGCPYPFGKVYRAPWSWNLQKFWPPVRVSTWWECHPFHLLGLSKDGFGVEGLQDSSLHSPNSSAPYRNSCIQGSSSGGCPKSSSPDSSWEPLAFRFSLMGVGSREGSSTLGSSNVTIFLDLFGLGETVHLLNGGPSTWAVCLLQPLCLWLLECLLLPECHQLLDCSLLLCHPHEMEWPSHSMCPSKHHCGSQCLRVGIPHYLEGLLPGLLLMIPVTTKMFTYSLCLGMVFCHSRHPSGSPWPLWLARTPPMMEAFSQWVQDLLVGLFHHLWTTWYKFRGPPQLADLLV